MIAALFDLDGTLYTGHIWQDLVRHHWAARQHRRWVVAYVARNMAPMPLYRLGLMSQATFYQSWGETMSWMRARLAPGQAQALFERLTEEQILPNLRADVLAQLHQHRDQGHLVALVSGTFAPWLEIVARRLDVPHAIGTPLEVRDGRYTGPHRCPCLPGTGQAGAGPRLSRPSRGWTWTGRQLCLRGQRNRPVPVERDRPSGGRLS